MKPATAPIAAGSMLGSYVLASRVGSRSGAVVTMLGALGWCARTWQSERGAIVSPALTAVYLGSFGLSHPLAKRIGAWPAVLGATAMTGAVTYAVADRR